MAAEWEPKMPGEIRWSWGASRETRLGYETEDLDWLNGSG